MNPDPPLTIPAMLAAIGQITADRIRAAAGDIVTISLSDLQLIYSYAYAINTELEIDAQLKSSPPGAAHFNQIA